MSEKRIIFTRADGGVFVIIPAPNVPMERVMQDIPADAIAPEVVTTDDIPSDRLFRNAWKVDGKKCVEDHTKCKLIAHEIRRSKRATEFAPHDEIISKQIPGKAATDAEAARVLIRAKYDKAQTDIDACTDPLALRSVLSTLT